MFGNLWAPVTSTTPDDEIIDVEDIDFEYIENIDNARGFHLQSLSNTLNHKTQIYLFAKIFVAFPCEWMG